MNDFRVQTDLRSRVSTKKLIRGLGHAGFTAWMFVQCEIRNRCPDGDTSNWEPLDWALAGDWDGDPRKLLEGLVEAGLVVRAESARDFGIPCHGDGWVPVDWRVEQGWSINEDSRKEAARRAGIASGEARRKKGHPQKSLFYKASNGHERASNGPLNNPFATTDTTVEPSPSLNQPSPSVPSLSLPSVRPNTLGAVGRRFEEIMGRGLDPLLIDRVMSWLGTRMSTEHIVACLEEADRAVAAGTAVNIIGAWVELVQNTKVGDTPRWKGRTDAKGSASMAQLNGMIREAQVRERDKEGGS